MAVQYLRAISPAFGTRCYKSFSCLVVNPELLRVSPFIAGRVAGLEEWTQVVKVAELADVPMAMLERLLQAHGKEVGPIKAGGVSHTSRVLSSPV